MAVYTAVNPGIQLPWTDVSINTQMVSNNAYNVLANCVLTLPPNPSKGDVIKVFLESGTGFTIAQNGPPVTGQIIIATGGSSTAGSGGSLVADTIGTSIELVCLENTTIWGLLTDQVSVIIN